MTPQADVLKGLTSDHAVVVKLQFNSLRTLLFNQFTSQHTCSNLIANPTHIVIFNSAYYVAKLCSITSCSACSCVINTLMCSVIILSEVRFPTQVLIAVTWIPKSHSRSPDHHRPVFDQIANLLPSVQSCAMLRLA